MAYITAGDIYTFGVYKLTTTAVESSVVSQFIEDAESLVNGKLAKQYSVPFTSTGIPPLIKRISRDIAAYYCLDFLL